MVANVDSCEQIGFSSILQCTGTIKHRLASFYLTVYRDYKTQIGLSSILQCTGTIKHRLAFLLSYSVQGL